MSDSALSYLYQEDLYQIPGKVTVILRRPWSSYSPEHQTLLSKILASVKLSLSSVQVLTADTFNMDALDHRASRILIFGSIADASIIPYQANQAQGFTIIRADDLPELDDQKKKSLWIALKSMFGM